MLSRHLLGLVLAYSACSNRAIIKFGGLMTKLSGPERFTNIALADLKIGCLAQRATQLAFKVPEE